MKKQIPMLDLARLHASLENELVEVFKEALAGGRFIGGPAVEKFEDELARHVGARFAVGVSSGTDGLLTTLTALNVGSADEIITTPYTFFATAGAIRRLGARPVFVDIDLDSYNIDATAVEAAITPRTVGIIPVHLFGQCAEMSPILALAEQSGLWVLEDAAQAIGASYNGRAAGTMGRAGVFSFFPAKNLGALGDAGAIVTNDAELADKVRALRVHGAKQKYLSEMVGGNFRLDAIQAAFLSVKLPHLDGWQRQRRAVAKRYDQLLGSIEDLVLPRELDSRAHVFNQYVVRTTKRERLAEELQQAGIGSAVYYPVPLHLQKCFADLGYGESSFVNSERAARETLALPIDPLLAESDQQRIAEAIERALG